MRCSEMGGLVSTHGSFLIRRQRGHPCFVLPRARLEMDHVQSVPAPARRRRDREQTMTERELQDAVEATLERQYKHQR